MSGEIINCEKCNKIFQRKLRNLCPECMRLADEQFTLLYRVLQESKADGGIHIDDLAARTGVPFEDIEKYYMEGRLSTAGQYLRLSCQSCKAVLKANERNYCAQCNQMTAAKAGVEIKSIQSIQKREDKVRFQQERLELLKNKPVPPAPAAPQPTYGAFIRRGQN